MRIFANVIDLSAYYLNLKIKYIITSLNNKLVLSILLTYCLHDIIYKRDSGGK